MAVRKRGDRWLATIFIANERTPDGMLKRRDKSESFDTKKEAQHWLAEQKRALIAYVGSL